MVQIAEGSWIISRFDTFVIDDLFSVTLDYKHSKHFLFVSRVYKVNVP